MKNQLLSLIVLSFPEVLAHHIRLILRVTQSEDTLDLAAPPHPRIIYTGHTLALAEMF